MNGFEQLSETNYAVWMQLYSDAQARMTTAAHRYTGTFVEVAAQHPLIDGVFPNIEFSKRLDKAIVLYKERKLYEQFNIYVPGGRHRDGDHVDKISLSEAGIRYLLEHGIPREAILPHLVDKEHTNGVGVYNSEAECMVASILFQQLHCGKFVCVCSTGQMMRKFLLYLRLGVLPDFEVCSVPGMHHNFIWEMFNAVPGILLGTDGERAKDLVSARKVGEE